MMRRIILIFFLCHCLGEVMAQQSDIDLTQSPIIGISTKSDRKGSGFVIGCSKDSVYIVSAAHVFKGYQIGESANLYLPNVTKPIIATLSFIADVEEGDIAMLSAGIKNYCFNKILADDNPDFSKDIFFIQSLEEKRQIIPAESPAYIKKYIDSIGCFDFHMYGLEAGDSGSALFSDKENPSLIGMVITGYPSLAIPVSHIKEIIQKHFRNKWQL